MGSCRKASPPGRARSDLQEDIPRTVTKSLSPGDGCWGVVLAGISWVGGEHLGCESHAFCKFSQPVPTKRMGREARPLAGYPVPLGQGDTVSREAEKR